MQIKPYNDESNCKNRNMTRINSTDFIVSSFSAFERLDL